MYITLATTEHISYITHALAPKQIDYIKPSQVKEDILQGRLYVIIHEGKPIGQCALVEEKTHNYLAMKRMVVYRKDCQVRGIANMFIEYFAQLDCPIGATPWSENEKMKYILRKNGFEYQYTFLEKYEFFLKKPLTN